MDKVQIYTVVLGGVELLCGTALLGLAVGNDDREMFDKILTGNILLAVLMTPILGRIFGIW